MDGTFGISHQAYDNRVDAVGDGKDFVQTTMPFVRNVFRKIYVLKDELSTVKLLENHKPSISIEVYSIIVHPGQSDNFEEVLKTIKEGLKRNKNKLQFTFYKLISGGEHPGYMMMVPRDNFAYFDKSNHFSSFDELIGKIFEGQQAVVLKNTLSGSIREIKGETWSYRANLSLIP